MDMINRALWVAGRKKDNGSLLREQEHSMKITRVVVMTQPSTELRFSKRSCYPQNTLVLRELNLNPIGQL